MDELKEFDRVINNFKGVIPKIPRVAGVEALRFIADRFRAQNWVDDTTKPWPSRKKGNQWGRKERTGRALLVDTGRLRRSPRIELATLEKVIIATDVPYAKAHNEGFRSTVTQQVKAHTRARTQLGIVAKRANKRSTRITYGRVKTGEIMVKAHQRTIRMKLPQRRFMGRSAVMARRIERQIALIITKALTNG